MSLINEALKKAQRLRNAETPTNEPPVPGSGGQIAKRAAPRSANTLVLIGSGAVVLVVLSVIATVFLLNRPSKREAAVLAVTSPATPNVESKAPAPGPAIAPPAIVVPVTRPAVAPISPSETLATAPVTEEPQPAEAPPKQKTAPAVPSSVATPPPLPASQLAENSPTRPEPAPVAPVSAPAEARASVPPPAAPTPAKLDERVVAFVDAIRVAGIRSSGDDSRVLMNDRVYRVNDIVDRPLGVRLVKVAVDSLTFSDASGMTYVKYF